MRAGAVVPTQSENQQMPNLRRTPGATMSPVFRSAAPVALTGQAQEEMAALGLGAVIDLREQEEASAFPVHLPEDVPRVAVPLYCGPIPLARPLDEVYLMLLEARGSRLIAALREISAVLPAPVLVHCKAGKDRTGLVVALLLEACQVPREQILADYELSAAQLPASYRQDVTTELVQALGADSPLLDTALELHLASPAGMLNSVLDILVSEYGSVANYLLCKGLKDIELAHLRQCLSPVPVQA